MISKHLFVLLAYLFVVMIGLGITMPVLPFYVERLALAEGVSQQSVVIHVALLTGVYALGQLIFAPIWGRLSDRTRRRPLILIGIAGYVIAQVLFGLATSLWLLYAAIAWMAREELEAIVDKRGAFDDVALRLAPGADERSTIAAVDRVLAPYGGRGELFPAMMRRRERFIRRTGRSDQRPGPEVTSFETALSSWSAGALRLAPRRAFRSRLVPVGHRGGESSAA